MLACVPVIDRVSKTLNHYNQMYNSRQEVFSAHDYEIAVTTTPICTWWRCGGLFPSNLSWEFLILRHWHEKEYHTAVIMDDLTYIID